MIKSHYYVHWVVFSLLISLQTDRYITQNSFPVFIFSLIPKATCVNKVYGIYAACTFNDV